MKRFFVTTIVTTVLFSCGSKDSSKGFEVNGTIANSTAKVIYLEEIPMATMQRNVVDSAVLGKDGKYKLQAKMEEARVYNLRLDQQPYPVAAVINDAPKITLNATYNAAANNQFAESYEVKGSAASEALKNYMFTFNGKLQEMFYIDRQSDSLRKIGGKDSAIAALQMSKTTRAAELKQLLQSVTKESLNPALTMFQIVYYQTSAGNPNFALEPVTKEEVKTIVDATLAKFPSHKSLVDIQSSLQGWIGKQAPEISLPDANGKTVSLSSYKGKYVLVDFWASWCKPCRMENPNVVNAYNKFKDKNFTILGVSLDQSKDEWQKAVMQDKLTWTHISDLRYWESVVVPMYKIEGIPYNVLVDPDGKIIAEALHGVALEEKLAAVLK